MFSKVPSVIINQKNLNSILVEARQKVGGITSLVSPYNKENIAKAVFVVAGKDFIKQTHLTAVSNPKAFHHIYEWNNVGRESSRLFRLNRDSVSGGRMIISSTFLRSTKQVPIAKELLVPGKYGKSAKSRYIFKDKASIMEDGKPLTIRPVRAKALVFSNNGKATFVSKPKSVKINNPGGKQVRGSFTEHMLSWFRNPVNISMSLQGCGMLTRLEKELARELNVRGAGSARTSTVVKRVTDSYSKGIKIL